MPEAETVDEYDMTKGPGVYVSTLTGLYCALPWSIESEWGFSVDFKGGKAVPA